MLKGFNFDGQNVLGYAALAFSLIGAVLAIVCYMPGAIKSFKYKDTRGISALMFALTFFGCIIWVIYSILMLINTGLNINSPSSGWTFVGGFATLISNFGLGAFSGVILFIKLRNMHNAKKEGISEDEYFKKHYEAATQEKMKRAEAKKAKKN